MDKSLSDKALQRMASLKLAWDPVERFEDEDEVVRSPEEIEAEDLEDAQALYDGLKTYMAQMMARRGYERALPLLQARLMEDPQSLWDAAQEDAYLWRDD